MEIIKLNSISQFKEIDETVIDKAVEAVKKGGSIVYPTDTVYGLGVNALSLEAVGRLFKIKKRPETKPVPVMVSDIEMAKKLAFIDKSKEAVLMKVWPGAVTVILEKRGIVPDILTAGKRTIGLRIPAHPLTGLLMKELNQPLTATSVNFSGEPPLTSSRMVIDIFKKHYPRPDLILDAGDLSESPPSTVLDLTTSQPKILRIGPVSKKELLGIFRIKD